MIRLCQLAVVVTLRIDNHRRGTALLDPAKQWARLPGAHPHKAPLLSPAAKLHCSRPLSMLFAQRIKSILFAVRLRTGSVVLARIQSAIRSTRQLNAAASCASLGSIRNSRFANPSITKVGRYSSRIKFARLLPGPSKKHEVRPVDRRHQETRQVGRSAVLHERSPS